MMSMIMMELLQVQSKGSLIVLIIIVSVLLFIALTIVLPLVRASNKRRKKIKENLAAQQTKPPNPEDYVVDKADERLFYNLKNKELCIRIINYLGKNDLRSKDKIFFALSLPHNFDTRSKRILLAHFPQLVDVDYADSHELLITKSPASKFINLEDRLLEYLFLHLHREYDWKFEKQIVFVEVVPNPDVIFFYMKVQPSQHKKLILALSAIEGLVDPKHGVPHHLGKYSFSLRKAQMFEWNQLLPEIKRVFLDYFSGGVEFCPRDSEGEV